jgi:hypothetical protein
MSLVLILNTKRLISDDWGFTLTLIPSLIMGTGSALGEATIIGALRNYPKNLITGWSSGTGMAGISGALLTLITKIFKIKTQYLYLFVSPLSLIFLAVFFLQEKMFNDYIKNKQTNYTNDLILECENDSEKIKIESKNDIETSIKIKYNSNDNDNDEGENNTSDEDVNNSEKYVSTNDNLNLSFENLILAFRYSSMFIINLGLVNKIII